MACRASFVQRHAAKHLLALAVMALLVPIAAQGASFSSSIQTPSSTCLPGLLCIFNTGGLATGGTQGLTMNGLLGSKTSTVFQIGTVGGGNSNLGTLSLTTGALLTGSLKTGGTLSAGRPLSYIFIARPNTTAGKFLLPAVLPPSPLLNRALWA